MRNSTRNIEAIRISSEIKTNSASQSPQRQFVLPSYKSTHEWTAFLTWQQLFAAIRSRHSRFQLEAERIYIKWWSINIRR